MKASCVILIAALTSRAISESSNWRSDGNTVESRNSQWKTTSKATQQSYYKEQETRSLSSNEKERQYQSESTGGASSNDQQTTSDGNYNLNARSSPQYPNQNLDSGKNGNNGNSHAQPISNNYDYFDSSDDVEYGSEYKPFLGSSWDSNYSYDSSDNEDNYTMYYDSGLGPENPELNDKHENSTSFQTHNAYSSEKHGGYDSGNDQREAFVSSQSTKPATASSSKWENQNILPTNAQYSGEQNSHSYDSSKTNELRSSGSTERQGTSIDKRDSNNNAKDSQSKVSRNTVTEGKPVWNSPPQLEQLNASAKQTKQTTDLVQPEHDGSKVQTYIYQSNHSPNTPRSSSMSQRNNEDESNEFSDNEKLTHPESEGSRAQTSNYKSSQSATKPQSSGRSQWSDEEGSSDGRDPSSSTHNGKPPKETEDFDEQLGYHGSLTHSSNSQSQSKLTARTQPKDEVRPNDETFQSSIYKEEPKKVTQKQSQYQSSSVEKPNYQPIQSQSTQPSSARTEWNGEVYSSKDDVSQSLNRNVKPNKKREAQPQYESLSTRTDTDRPPKSSNAQSTQSSSSTTQWTSKNDVSQAKIVQVSTSSTPTSSYKTQQNQSSSSLSYSYVDETYTSDADDQAYSAEYQPYMGSSYDYSSEYNLDYNETYDYNQILNSVNQQSV